MTAKRVKGDDRQKQGRARPSWWVLRRIVPYAARYKGRAFASVSLVLLSSLFALLEPWPLAFLVDTVLGDNPAPSFLTSLFGDGTFILLLVAVLAGFIITLGLNGFAVIGEYANTGLHERMVLDFRSDLFRHSHRLPLSFHETQLTGRLMKRITLQPRSIGAVTLAFPPLMQSGLTLVGMFFIAMTINLQLALISITVVPFIYYSIGYYGTRIVPQVRRVRSLEGQSLSIVHEAMAMVRVVRAFGREAFEYRRFRDQGQTAVDARINLSVRQTLFSMAVNGLTAAGTALVLGFGALNVLRGRLTVGQLLVLISYVAAVYKPLQDISSSVATLQEQVVILETSFRLLDIDPEIKDAPDAVAVERARGSVGFEGVSFTYKGRKATLTDVSFRAEPGQVVAVIGPTGAGKTTLVSLIPRFYDPRDGRVLLDGTDVRKLTVDSLRQQVSIVLQEPLLFSGTVADNIRYGRLEATEEEVREAAKAANAHDFIMAFPQKYQTKLGEGGANLSGGERQRISVARAFLKDAPILILDEPTSSIDSKTEEPILDALDRLMAGRTTFMIAHRLSTVRGADLYLVVDGGRIVEQGSREELLGQDGLFKELYRAQVGDGDLPARRAPDTARDAEVPVLARRLSSSKKQVRERAVQVLRQRPRKEVVAWARRSLASGTPREATLAAPVAETLSLKKLSRPLLGRAAALPDASRGPLVRALSSFSLDPEEMVGEASKLPPQRRPEAIRVVGGIFGPNAFSALRPFLLDRDESIRLAALEVFGEAGDTEALEVATGLFRTDLSPDVRAAAVRTMGRFLREDRRSLLAEAMGDRAAEVRTAAVELLPLNMDSEDVVFLLRALGDTDERVWGAAGRWIVALSEGEFGRVRSLVLERLLEVEHRPLPDGAGPPPSLDAERVADALAGLDGEPLAPGLHVDRAASQSRGTDGPETPGDGQRRTRVVTALRPLTALLYDAGPRFAGAMARLAARIAGPEPFTRRLTSSLHPEERLEAVEALGAMGGPTAVEGLIRGLSDPRSQVRIRALEILGELGDRRAADAVREAYAEAAGQLALGRAVLEEAATAERALRTLDPYAASEPSLPSMEDRR